MDAAVEVFWSQGYDGASMDDLTESMGINRPSLYGAFGGKKQLYLDALSRYASGIGSKAMQAFLEEPDIHLAVKKMFTVSLECQARTGNLAQGCMLANCAPATLDSVPEARSFLYGVSQESHAKVKERFAEEVVAGNLSTAFPIDERASLLLDCIQAQAYRARIGESRKKLHTAIPGKAELVLHEEQFAAQS